MDEDDQTDGRFPPQITRGEVALMIFVLVQFAVAVGVIVVLLFRP
jgi:hypothetical protein